MISERCLWFKVWLQTFDLPVAVASVFHHEHPNEMIWSPVGGKINKYRRKCNRFTNITHLTNFHTIWISQKSIFSKYLLMICYFKRWWRYPSWVRHLSSVVNYYFVNNLEINWAPIFINSDSTNACSNYEVRNITISLGSV